MDKIKLSIEPHELFLLLESMQHNILNDHIVDRDDRVELKNYIVRFLAFEATYRKIESCCDKYIHKAYLKHKKEKISLNVEDKIKKVFEILPADVRSATYGTFVKMNKVMVEGAWE